jgi:hypothetical protein
MRRHPRHLVPGVLLFLRSTVLVTRERPVPDSPELPLANGIDISESGLSAYFLSISNDRLPDNISSRQAAPEVCTGRRENVI